MIAFLLVRLHGFARDPRGSASIELAIGSVVLISAAALSFDLYSRIKADTAVARMAITMADYVSRDVDPDGNEMKALGVYLYDHELGVPANLVYVVTALHQPPGDPRPDVVVLWSDDTIRIGDSAVTEDARRRRALTTSPKAEPRTSTTSRWQTARFSSSPRSVPA